MPDLTFAISQAVQYKVKHIKEASYICSNCKWLRYCVCFL